MVINQLCEYTQNNFGKQFSLPLQRAYANVVKVITASMYPTTDKQQLLALFAEMGQNLMARNQRLTLFSSQRSHKNVEQTALYLYETQKPFDKDLEFIVA